MKRQNERRRGTPPVPRACGGVSIVGALSGTTGQRPGTEANKVSKNDKKSCGVLQGSAIP